MTKQRIRSGEGQEEIKASTFYTFPPLFLPFLPVFASKIPAIPVLFPLKRKQIKYNPSSLSGRGADFHRGVPRCRKYLVGFTPANCKDISMTKISLGCTLG